MSVDVEAERSRLEQLAVLPEDERRLEVGYTPVGERACIVCAAPLAGQVAYLLNRHSSARAACGACVTESRYLSYTEDRWTPRPALSKAMWLESYAGAQLPEPCECEICGAAFARLVYRFADRRTCSYDCEAERERRRKRVPKVERPCIVCGELFTPKRRDGRTHSDACRKALSRMSAEERSSAEKRDEEWRSRNTAAPRRAEANRDEVEPSPAEVAAAAIQDALRYTRWALDSFDVAAGALREDPEAEVAGLPADARRALLAWERPRPGVAAGRLLGLDVSQVDADRARAVDNRDEATA